jgi:hypothetical protein
MNLEMILAIRLHKTCPWIPHFKRILIRYLSEVPWNFLGQDVIIGGIVYNVPTDDFWFTHVNTAHHGGIGCSVPVHVAYLTEGGRIADFEYGVQLTDLTFRVYGREEFEIECKWWRENYPRLLKEIKQTTPERSFYE